MVSETLARRRALRAARPVENDAPDTRPVAEFLYRRISSDQEGRELGVTKQRVDLHASIRADYPNHDDVDVRSDYCDNDRSASTNCDDERPDYDRMLRDARAAAESGRYRAVVIRAYTSNRLTRRPREYEDLIDLVQDYAGVVKYKYLRSPSFDLNTAAGRRIGRMMAAQDAGEPEDISERVLARLEQLLLMGEFTGGRPGFGFRLEYDYTRNGLPIKPGRLVIIEEEAELIRDSVNRLLGGESMTEIAARWAEKTGTKRWPQDVERILVRGRNAGLTERYGEPWGRGKWGHLADENDPDGEWCAIITESELAAVRAKIAQRTQARRAKRAEQRTSRGAPEEGRRWLGSGKYICGRPDCGLPMRSTSGAKRGHEPRYTCSSSYHLTIDAAAVDAKVRNQVAVLLAQHGVNLLAGVHTAEHEQLTRKANKLRAKMDALALAFAEDDRADARALVLATRPLEDELAKVERERDTLVVPGKALEGIADAEDPVAAFLEAPLSRQRAVMDVLVTVTIKPGQRGRQPAGTKVTDRVIVEPVRAVASGAA